MDEGYELITSEARAMQAVRVEIDSAISTAKQYPRDVTRAFDTVLAMSTRTPEIAARCFYTLPGRRDNKTGQVSPPIQGASIRLLEIFQSAWQNLRTGARVVSIDKVANIVTVQGVAYDLENNVRVDQEVTRRFYKSDDSLNNAINAASSIAIRNCLRRIIGPYVEMAYEECKHAVANAGQPAEQLAKAIDAFCELGATEQQILDLLGIASVDQATRKHVTNLRGLYTSIHEGYVTLDAAFGAAEGALSGDATSTAQESEPEPQKPASAAPLNPAVEAADIAVKLGWKPKQFEDFCGENFGNKFAKLSELDQATCLTELRDMLAKAAS